MKNKLQEALCITMHYMIHTLRSQKADREKFEITIEL